MELGKTSYVILGMLRHTEHTGYEIKSAVDVSTRFFWAASYGQIYPELKRLEEAGLIAGRAEATGGRQRRAYALTAEGRRVLQDWLASGGPLHFELRHEGLLRFFFADAATRTEQVELVRTIRAEHERVRGELEAIRAAKAGPGSPDPFPFMTLAFGIAYQEFVIAWCSDTERRLEQQSNEKTGS